MPALVDGIQSRATLCYMQGAAGGVQHTISDVPHMLHIACSFAQAVPWGPQAAYFERYKTHTVAMMHCIADAIRLSGSHSATDGSFHV